MSFTQDMFLDVPTYAYMQRSLDIVAIFSDNPSRLFVASWQRPHNMSRHLMTCRGAWCDPIRSRRPHDDERMMRRESEMTHRQTYAARAHLLQQNRSVRIERSSQPLLHTSPTHAEMKTCSTLTRICVDTKNLARVDQFFSPKPTA